MASYDSDSSDGDDASYSTTNVLLGYASKEPTDDTFSQLGGYPSWPETSSPSSSLTTSSTTSPSSSQPSARFAQCGTCNGYTNLLLQLNADLPDRFVGHERRLYIFSCKRKACRRKAGSVRALRGSKKNRIAAKQQDSSSSRPNDRPIRGDESDDGSGEKKMTGLEKRNAPEAQQQGTGTLNLGDSIFNSTSMSNPPTAAKGLNSNPFAMSTGSGQRQTTRIPSNPFSSSQSSTAANRDSKTVRPPQEHDQDKEDHARLPALFSEKVRLDFPDQTKQQSDPTPQPIISWPPQSELPSPYPSYHIDAEYESLDNTPSPSTAPGSSNTKMEIDSATNEDSNNSLADKEAFESTIDKTFQRFADRIAQNPEQILRYEFDGTPLLYSHTDPVGQRLSGHSLTSSTSTFTSNAKIKTAAPSSKNSLGTGGSFPPCPSCSAARVFELQLVPHAITELEAEEEGLEGMDWGTIILGVCSRDCTGTDTGTAAGDDSVASWSWKEEWVGVQWEELESKAKK